MGEVASAYVSLLPSLKGFGKSVSNQIGGDLDKAGVDGGKRFGKGMSGGIAGMGRTMFAPLAAAFATVGIGSFFKDAIGGASDLNESVSKVGVVFGKQFAPQIVGASKTAATAMGLSQNAYLAATGTLGNLLVSLGVAPKASSAMSQGMVKLAGDLASFNNVSPEEALAAIQSGLTGETEPLKKFGVNMNDATLKAQALKMHLIKTTSEALTPQSKALAAQALIMAQTGTAQGDFARTSGGLANQQRILSAQFEDVKTKLGGALLPVVTTVTTFLNNNLGPALTAVGGLVAGLGAGFVAFGGFLSSNSTTIGVIGGVITAVFLPALIRLAAQATISAAAQVAAWATTAAGAIAASVASVAQFVIQGAKWAWMGVQALLGAAKIALAWVISMGPIAIVAAAVIGLGVLIFKNMDTIKGWIGGAWTWVKTTTKAAWDWVLSTTQSVWGSVTGFFAGIPAKVSAAIQGVIGFVKTVFSYTPLGIVITNFGAIVSFIGGIPGKILGALSGLGGLLVDAGASIMRGLLSGITAGFEAVKNFVGGIGSWIADHKGPLSYDRKLLIPAGNALMSGLNAGIEAGFADVQSNVSGLAGRLSIPRVGSLDFASSADRAGAVAGSNGADVVAAIEQLGRVFGAELDRQARTIQTMQRQMAG